MATADQNQDIPEGTAPLGSLHAYETAYKARYKPGDHIGGHIAGLRAVVLLDRKQRAEAAAAVTKAKASAPDEVVILYTNHRGVTAVRRITPIGREWFGSSEWHPEPQWLFTAFDMDKKVFRDFARVGVKAWGQDAVGAALAAAPEPAPPPKPAPSSWQDMERASFGEVKMVLLSAAAPEPAAVESFQERVRPWLLACFGEMIAGDREERNHRFLEESLELVQACGCTASEAHQLVDYVFSRPAGAKGQEVGGVKVTLAALCLAQGLDMHAEAETELARIWTKVEQIRAKQAAKPKHSPLPEAQTL